MKYWPISLLFILLGVSRSAEAQTYTISGKVVDEEGFSLYRATVFLVKGGNTEELDPSALVIKADKRVETDENGMYSLEGIEPGRFTISAFYSGKSLKTRDIEVSSDLDIDFTLTILESIAEDIIIEGAQQKTFGITKLRSVEGVGIYEAKKSEVVVVEDITANLATNNSRQVYAKVAGLNIWESDGAGVQLGIGGRGLSPNRNSNFNTRQNGYDISADALGYPESYYTPPIQGVKRIEIIRGAASLQYGTQFGGVLNFIFKEGPENKPFEFQTTQSTGSFGLFSSFNSFGGTIDNGKLSYYGFYQYKRSNGFRPNSSLDQHTAYASVKYKVTPKLSIKPEYTFSSYLAQQPGGLTDAQFESNARQSNRERNWFNVDWNLFSLTGDYVFSPQTTLNSRFFGLVAGRNAVGNLGRIDRLDFGGNRDLLKDDFRNWGNETRLIHRYGFLNSVSVFLVGTRYYSGFTIRQQGDGSAGSDADFNYLNPDNLEGSDFDLPSRNASVFIENIFNVTPQFSITPGVRFEYINTEANGFFRNTVRDLAGNILLDERINEDRSNERSFVFFGLGLSYKTKRNLEVYANFSQNYRAINFNDIRVNVGSLQVDPNISDERGFNIELGARGSASNVLSYDVSLFHLSYQDRIGTVLRTEPNPLFNNLVNRTFRFRTNVADASIYGIESYAELDLYKLFFDKFSATRVSVFSNIALITATYANSDENGVEGNEVELVPDINLKTGVTVSRSNLEVSYQFSFVGEQFSDATNAIRTPSAIEGIIPSYHVMDISAKYTVGRYRLEAGVNNLSDNVYFTRRATGYPGPGILPSDGRNAYITVGVNF